MTRSIAVVAEGLTRSDPCGGGPCGREHVAAWLDALELYVDQALAVFSRRRRLPSDAERWLVVAHDLLVAAHGWRSGEPAALVATLVEGCEFAEAARQAFAADVLVAGEVTHGARVGLTLAGGLALLVLALAVWRLL